ncbi:MAG: hypothetical protein RMX61_01025 [Planktomarina sp.]|nr:hypothetical protein [Planktomarina sp.]MDT2032672.1 hypothetical protein [Planktomarina sp.]MDT2039514.1 hypothetical protein [Planktomarina sp.]MDT2049279.1 hypothetical protein [Planktomarina sp.]|tara:strand:+ start:1393 stop:1581 length:189 start_codon:yes stop_codon:yes gene_type:complete
MAIRVESEMHRRRRSQNFGVAICLVLFIFLMMGLSFVKLTNSGPVEGYDHAPRPSMEETELK